MQVRFARRTATNQSYALCCEFPVNEVLLKIMPTLSRLVVTGFCLLLANSALQATPIAFPSGLVPLTSIEYSSAPDANGIRLVLGDSTFQAFAALRSLPAPADGQQFSDSSIELAPGQFFSNVYVPTAAELEGNFQDFGGAVIDPFSGQPFPGNLIPTSRLGGIYAFRVGPAAAPVPEPGSLYTLSLLAIALGARLLVRRVV